MVMRMLDQRGYLAEPGRFPRLTALVARADACVASGTLADLTDDCRNPFDQLLNSRELTDIVTEALLRQAQGETSHPEWLSKTAEEWVVLDTPDYSLRLTARKPRPGPLLQSLNFNCLVGNMSGPALTITCYRFPDDSRNDAFRVGLHAVEGERTTLQAGQSLELLANRDIPNVTLQAPVLTLTLYPKLYAPLIWCFDRQSLQSVMAMASHDSPVRRQAGAAMLQHIHQSEELPVEASLDTLSTLAQDSSHFVRWAALQGLCSIDLDHARPHLIRAAEDPHPAVAAAARRAIVSHFN